MRDVPAALTAWQHRKALKGVYSVAKDSKTKFGSGPNDARTVIRDTIREHEDRKPNKTTDDILRALDAAGYSVQRKRQTVN